MNKKIADYLKNNPPFVIEITLNAADKEHYELISQVECSYEKTIEGLNSILERKLPLKIKTQVTRDNLKELPRIKKFIESLGQKFMPTTFLHARLNKDITPCTWRIPPYEAFSLYRKKPITPDDCQFLSLSKTRKPQVYLFNCTISGGDGIYVDPSGNIVPCNCIREPKINLLKEDIKEAKEKILDWARTRTFTKKSECKGCSFRNRCLSCPGKALLEKKSLEGRIEWFCQLARLIAKK